MKFGLFFLNFLHSGQSCTEIFDAMTDSVNYAEKGHFDRLFIYENHFSDHGIVGAPLTVASFLLGMTERIKVGSLNHVLTTHHPVRTAEETGLLDQMSQGRFILGFSDCENRDEMNFFNRPLDSQQPIFEACYHIINDALTTGYCHPNNDFYSFPKISVNPHCFTQGGPQQYVYASSTQVVEWAAKRALPLTFKWDDSNATRQEYAQRYQETARKHGVDVQAVRHQLALLVNQNDDGDIARAEARQYLSQYLTERYSSDEIEIVLERIIKESAIGTYEESTHAARVAIEMCGASDLLLSVESIKEPAHRLHVLEVINSNIAKYHQ